MVVWFRHGSCAVGLEDGLVRAGDFAVLQDFLHAARAAEAERDSLLSDVGREIEAMRSEARRQIEEEIAAARSEREQARQAGFAEGAENAATHWAESALREGASTQRTLMRQTERLSHIVSLALDRVIEQEDRVVLFNRALSTITKIVREVPVATLRVNPSELDSAVASVAGCAPCVAGLMQIEVTADSSLPPGSCLFESDNGIVDAGLNIQLAAIRRAIKRAAEQMLLDEADESSAAVTLSDEAMTKLSVPHDQNDEPAGMHAAPNAV